MIAAGATDDRAVVRRPVPSAPTPDGNVLIVAMRAARLRLRLVEADIEEVEITLAAGHISPVGAIYWLHHNSVADLVLSAIDAGRAAT